MKPVLKIDSSTFTAEFIVERTGRNLQGESIYRRPWAATPVGHRGCGGQTRPQAVVTILNQIYEVDFKGFSYGFRPGRSPHQALDALTVSIQRKKVNWILDADVIGFFDNLATNGP